MYKYTLGREQDASSPTEFSSLFEHPLQLQLHHAGDWNHAEEGGPKSNRTIVQYGTDLSTLHEPRLGMLDRDRK